MRSGTVTIVLAVALVAGLVGFLRLLRPLRPVRPAPAATVPPVGVPTAAHRSEPALAGSCP